MDDNSGNGTENQSSTMVVEEVAPEVTTPEEVLTSDMPPALPPDMPADIPADMPPVIYEDNSGKYKVMAGMVIFFVIVLIIFLKLILGGGGIKSSKPINLVYWGLWEEKEVFEPLIAQYQAKNKNVTIEYQKMSEQDYLQKLISRSKSGQGPDIFRFHNTWVPQLQEVITALPSTIMSNKDFEATFYPVHQSDLKVGNNFYGLPLSIDGLVLICNEDLFKRAGITSMPTNWDEVIDAAAKLSVKDQSGNLVTGGIAIGLTSNIEHFSDIFGLILLQNGANLQQLNQETAAGALESYRKFAENPENNFWDESMPNSITAFIQEKVAMVIAPSWQVLSIKATNPDIKIKVVGTPVVPGGKPVALASYWVEGVSKYSKNQIEAWKFVKYLTEKENLTKLYENESKVRLFGEPYSRVDLASTLVQNEYIGPVIEEAKYFVSLPLNSRTFDNGLNDEIIRYIENAINATVQGGSYSEALNTASAGVTQILSRFNK